MEGKIVVDEKEIAVFTCDDNGFSVKCTDEGKKICKDNGCC